MEFIRNIVFIIEIERFQSNNLDSLYLSINLFFSRADTSNFASTVRDYNEKEPFNMTRPRFSRPGFSKLAKLKDINIFIPPAAAHLYDSVVLYAKVKAHVILFPNIHLIEPRDFSSIYKVKLYFSIFRHWTWQLRDLWNQEVVLILNN